MNRNKQLTINLVASILAFTINVGINFFLTPYITNNIGVEAYGFVSLGTQFINYASLVTIALNSMAGRFITIEIHKANWKTANKYFNSVLLSNVIVAGVMVIPSILVITYLDNLVDIPADILIDVQFLFGFLFANYLISIIVSSFGVSTFATNKLHLKSMREIESRILKVVLLILLFVLFEPAVFYLGFTATIVMLYLAFFNIYYTKKFLPKLKINIIYFEKKAVMDLISSGIWNTVNSTGEILLKGVDIFIANLFIGATAMGVLALSKTIPAVISSLVAVVGATFMPDFTFLFANENSKLLIKSIKQSMRISSIISVIPLTILVVFGQEFFSLWVPSENTAQLYILSVMTVSTLVVSGL